MTRACIGIGSNIDPGRHVPWAVDRIQQESALIASAPTYRTAALDRPDQPDYWNTAVQVDWQGNLIALQGFLRRLEQDAGRIRSEDAYAARELDLDVWTWDGVFLDATAAEEVRKRPWDAWCYHHLGQGPRPDMDEPTQVT